MHTARVWVQEGRGVAGAGGWVGGFTYGAAPTGTAHRHKRHGNPGSHRQRQRPRGAGQVRIQEQGRGGRTTATSQASSSSSLSGWYCSARQGMRDSAQRHA
jgi:hypothetical protein